MHTQLKIIKCKITDMPKSLFDPMPQVIVTMEDGKEFNLFSFYPDEIRFTEDEFIGLTRMQAMGLHHERDVRYLMT